MRGKKTIQMTPIRGGWIPLEKVDLSTDEWRLNLRRPDWLVEAWVTPIGASPRYCVQIKHEPCSIGLVRHLFINRGDQLPIHDWKVLQRIKNEVAGTEAQAVEFYPKESEIVDKCNIYHLWVLPDGYDLPFGMKKGD